MKLIYSLPPDSDNLHRGRAWEFASHLMANCDLHLVKDGCVPSHLWEVTDGVLVANSENDIHILSDARNRGIPAIYYPSFGPVDQYGFLADTTLHQAWHLMPTRAKLLVAHVVLTESWVQAISAQSHYAMAPAWLVHPGGPAFVVRQENRDYMKIFADRQPTNTITAKAEFVIFDHASQILHQLKAGDMLMQYNPVFHPSIWFACIQQNVKVCTGQEQGIWDEEALYIQSNLSKSYDRVPASVCPTWESWWQAIKNTILRLKGNR